MSKQDQQIATTKEGTQVILKSDGTWSMLKDETPTTSPNQFRKASWGMSKNEILSLEPTKPIKDTDNNLIFSGKLSGLSCLIIYIFVQGQFVRGKYLFNEEHSNKNKFITEFGNLKEMLIKKYGQPLNDETAWQNDLYKNDFQEWGNAVSIGHLSFFATWVTPSTDLTIMLSGDNYVINLGIEYVSKELEYLESQAQDNEALENL